MAELSDEQLVAGIAQGDRDAGREFFLRYRQGAFRIAYRLVGNEADAMDVVEDAFVKLLGAAGKFRGEAKASTWFYRIVTNTALDLRRKRGRYVTMEPGDEESAGIKYFLPSREEGPEDAALRGETASKIEEAIKALSEKHRSVFMLAVVEGLSYRETAEVLDISAGTVMSRLFYARKYLQESLGDYLGVGDE